MGGGQSTTEFGTLSLKILNQKEFYAAGEYIPCQVDANITKIHPGGDAFIVLYGQSTVQGVSEDSKTHVLTPNNKTKNELFLEDRQRIFHNIPDSIGTGQYSWYLDYKVPTNALASFALDLNKVEYKIVAETNNHRTNLKKKAIDEKGIRIGSCNNQQNGAFDLSFGDNVTCCFCIPMGRIDIKCTLEKDWFMPNEEIVGKCEIQNSGKQAISAVSIAIQRRVRTVYDTKKPYEFTNVVDKKEIQTSLAAGANGEVEIRLTVPYNLKECPSINSDRLTCEYYLIIAPVVALGSMNLSTKITITTVGKQVYQPLNAMMDPSMMNPNMMSMMNTNMNYDPNMGNYDPNMGNNNPNMGNYNPNMSNYNPYMNNYNPNMNYNDPNVNPNINYDPNANPMWYNNPNMNNPDMMNPAMPNAYNQGPYTNQNMEMQNYEEKQPAIVNTETDPLKKL